MNGGYSYDYESIIKDNQMTYHSVFVELLTKDMSDKEITRRSRDAEDEEEEEEREMMKTRKTRKTEKVCCLLT